MVSVWVTDDEVVSIGDSVATLLTPQNVTNGLSLTIPGAKSYGNLVIIVGDHINRMDETVECQTDDLPTQVNTYIDIGEYFRGRQLSGADVLLVSRQACYLHAIVGY